MPHAGPLLDEPKPLSDLLKIALKRPNEPAVTSLEAILTWSDLDKASSRLAANYLALGLQPGDRVASLMPNRCR
jgi:long-chain acyl-CoA synthetase